MHLADKNGNSVCGALYELQCRDINKVSCVHCIQKQNDVTNCYKVEAVIIFSEGITEREIRGVLLKLETMLLPKQHIESIRTKAMLSCCP